MSSPPFLPPPSLTPQDVEQLKIVAILYYVVAGVIALTGFASIIHLGIGLAMLSGIIETKPDEEQGLRVMGAVFTGLALLWMLLWWAMAALVAYGARNLQRRRNWLLAMIIAGLLCLHTPLGTLLGVFTFLILMRPNVKAVFQASSQLTAP
jgi:hypothetical protein